MNDGYFAFSGLGMRKRKPAVAARKRQVSILVGFFFLAFVVVNVVDFVNDHFFPASNAKESQALQAEHGGDEYILSGRVVRVADGDTFTLRVGNQNNSVRVASIDAPETQGQDRPGQPYAQVSRRKLEELIANKNLDLLCYEQDHYGRHVCDVPLKCDAQTSCDPQSEGNTTTASRVLVKSGLAWANEEKQGKFLRDLSLREMEKQARSQRLGLWQDSDPIQPWVWRYQCWRQKQCD